MIRITYPLPLSHYSLWFRNQVIRISLKRIFFPLLLLIFCANSFAQNKSLFSKYYVKENAVLLRWVPLNKQVFDLGVRNGYKITRYTKENNTLTLPVVIAENIKPYNYNDSIKWASLIRKNKNAIFILQALYQNQNTSKSSAKEKEEQEKMLYDLVLLSCDFNAEIAQSCGLYFKDSAVSNLPAQAGATIYSYKIEINNTHSSSKIFPTIMEVNAKTLSINPVINNFTGTFKNKQVKLKWKATDFTNYYGAYNIERSSDSVLFKKINGAPVILLTSQYEKKKEFITYNDTFPRTGIKYYYRIKGINHFGEESNPSNVISGIGYDALQSMPIIDSIKVIENKKVFIRWKMKDLPAQTGEKANNLPKEYVLVRSEKDNGPYSEIHTSQQQFSFIDETPKQSNYYKIGAVSYGNDTIYSYSYLALIADTIPPSVPTGMKAKADSKGNVEITWNKNPESDIQGYKIFKANARTEEFVQVNNTFAKTASYKDKLNLKTLSKKIYYSIAAVDNNYNSSPLSVPIEIKRPDTIPPVPPVIKNLQITTDGIKVSWIPSSSEDVKQYMLYHQKANATADVMVKSWNNSDTITSFMDTALEIGTGYRFKIITMDEDDNIAVSNAPYMLFETGFRKKITDIKAETDRTKKTITLRWKYPEKGIEKFVLYRSQSKEPLSILKTISFPSSVFEDSSPSIGNTYAYRIKGIFKNGAESIISDAIIVEY